MIWAAATAATLDKGLDTENNNVEVITAQSRPPVVKVCVSAVWVGGGYAQYKTDMEASFAGSNDMWLMCSIQHSLSFLSDCVV